MFLRYKIYKIPSDNLRATFGVKSSQLQGNLGYTVVFLILKYCHLLIIAQPLKPKILFSLVYAHTFTDTLRKKRVCNIIKILLPFL